MGYGCCRWEKIGYGEARDLVPLFIKVKMMFIGWIVVEVGCRGWRPPLENQPCFYLNHFRAIHFHTVLQCITIYSWCYGMLFITAHRMWDPEMPLAMLPSSLQLQLWSEFNFFGHASEPSQYHGSFFFFLTQQFEPLRNLPWHISAVLASLLWLLFVVFCIHP